MPAWTETLDGPRSLITGPSIALVGIEDPGVVELRGPPRDRALAKAAKLLLGAPLPQAPWSSVENGALRAVWRGPGRWWLLTPRAEAGALAADLTETIGRKALAVDMTGAQAALRLVGAKAGEALARTCPLDLRAVAPFEARVTTLSGIKALLFREAQEVPVWLILVARSYAPALARELAEAIRTTADLDLFGDRMPPV